MGNAMLRCGKRGTPIGEPKKGGGGPNRAGCQARVGPGTQGAPDKARRGGARPSSWPAASLGAAAPCCLPRDRGVSPRQQSAHRRASLAAPALVKPAAASSSVRQLAQVRGEHTPFHSACDASGVFPIDAGLGAASPPIRRCVGTLEVAVSQGFGGPAGAACLPARRRSHLLSSAAI